VHDKLFGGKGKGKARAAGGKKGRGKAEDDDEGGGDEDALRALIQQKGAQRMEALIDNLEAKYGKEQGKGKVRGPPPATWTVR
jgi:DnaJ family protein C protein 9